MTVAPIYLQEIAPSGWSNIFGVSFSLGLNFGTLLGQFFGLEEVLGGAATWQYIFMIGAVPAAIQLLLSRFIIESPVFRRKKYSSGSLAYSASISKSSMSLESGKSQKNSNMVNPPEIIVTNPTNPRTTGVNLESLPLPRSPLPKDSIPSKTARPPLELQNSTSLKSNSSLLSETSSYKETIEAIIKTPKMRNKFGSACIYIILQNWTGIPCIYFYSHSLFKDEFMLTGQSAAYATLAVSACTIISISISMVLITRIGVKYSYIISIFGMGISSFSIYAAGFKLELEWLRIFSLISTIMFIAFSQIGVLPIPFMLVGEWFKPSYRTKCQAMIISLAFANTTLVGNLFPWMIYRLENYTFFILAINCGIGGIFAFIQM